MEKCLGLADLSKAIQWLAAVIGFIAFLVFFALSPLHALLLCGLLVILVSFISKADPSIQKYALFLGIAIMVVGGIGIFLPSFARTLLSLADTLKGLLLLEV